VLCTAADGREVIFYPLLGMVRPPWYVPLWLGLHGKKDTEKWNKVQKRQVRSSGA